MENFKDFTEYDMLKSSVVFLKTDLERKNQLIYNLKQEIGVVNALEGDYVQEIEILQSNGNAEVMKLQKTIKEIEEDILHLRNSSSLMLLQKLELIDSLQNEVNMASKNLLKNVHSDGKCNEVNTDAERNSTLKTEIKVLSDSLVEVQTCIDNVELQNANLEETNRDMETELDHAKENLKCKMHELVETKNLIHNLQEESLLIERELESLKNKPLDVAVKGNSLFAEVEDSCLKTQQNIQQLKKKYVELKRDVHNKLKQMTAIRAQNTELSHQLNLIKNSDEEYEKVIEENKIKVTDLEWAVEQYKQEVMKDQKFTSKDLPTSSVEFANDMLKTKWNDCLKLRDELNHQSKEKLETFINIKNANTEMRKWRQKALQVKLQVEKLKNTILEMELQSSPTNNIASKIDLDF